MGYALTMSRLRFLIACSLVGACSASADAVDPPVDTDDPGHLSCTDILDSNPWEFGMGLDFYEQFPDLYACDEVCDRSGSEVLSLESCTGPTARTRDDGGHSMVFTCAGVRLIGTMCD
jgi:hypothetical protein